ncbi:MAG: PadR family transcriptional regulator [Eubacterium sp.]|nr:PadR family transcriptional regulator [Eubacterium sp.]
MREKYERQMKKGVLDMLVLQLLSKEQMYGYQLIMELREKSGDIFCLKEGTLYPILYRLEDEGLVESRWSEAEDKQLPRKYYLMTNKGRQALQEIYLSWQQISSGVERIMGTVDKENEKEHKGES